MKRLVWILMALVAGVFIGWLARERHGCVAPQGEVTREVFVDTATVTHPAPVDSVPVRTDIVRLPVVRPDRILTCRGNPGIPQTTDTEQTPTCLDNQESVDDSVTVAVPIQQYEFADSTYRLLVSGFRVQVDELEVYPRREVVTIRKPPSRWAIGPTAGVALTPRGVQPYVGFGVTYVIWGK